jgi:crotonobetaine/carnitine-CoA ligase
MTRKGPIEMAEVSIADALVEFGTPDGLGFREVFAHISAEPADKLAAEFRDELVTYGQLARRVAGAVEHLESLRLGPGDHVAYMLQPHPHALYTMLAVPLAGALLAPANPAMRGPVLESLIRRYRLRAVVTDASSHGAVVEAIAGLDDPPLIVASHDSPYSAAIERGADPAFLLERDYPRPSDPGLLLSTSGTTGEPKGVIQANTWAGAGYITSRKWGFEGPPKYYVCLSWGYAAVIFQVTLALTTGGSVIIAERFSASGMWDDLRRRGGTHVQLMGTMHRALFAQPARDDDASYRKVIVTSAGMPGDIWAEFERRFNVDVYEVYTSTDGGGCWMVNPGVDPVGSVGRPWAEIEARIVDDEDQLVEQGHVGELQMRPVGGVPVVNYLDDPEASADKTRGGWVRMGDFFREDANGAFYFVDRKRDMIRRKSMTVPPASVERVLLEHPDIEEASAFGVPAELGEDDIKVVVVRRPGRMPSEAEIMTFARAQLPEYMQPRYLEFVPELPTTGLAKIQRFRLRDGWRTRGTWDAQTGAALGSDSAR